MNSIKITILLILLCNTTFTQNLKLEFGDFSEATSLSINNLGNIFVCDSDRNEITKFDSLGKKIISVGGYGWEDSAFDYPSDVFASSLNIYITDKNNNRVQIFDKDLNYLSSVNSDENNNPDYAFSYPAATIVSSIGDFFILDSDNARILKYDLKGNFVLEIGGNDAGEYSLSDPTSFAISKYLKLYVLDEDKIIVFDQFGNFLSDIDFGLSLKKVRVIENQLLLISDFGISGYKLNSSYKKLFKISNEDFQIEYEIVDISFMNNKLYVLSPNQISVYDFSLP